MNNDKLVWRSDETTRICNDNSSYSPQMEQKSMNHLRNTIMDSLDERVIRGITFGNNEITKTNETWTSNSTCTSETSHNSENIVESMTNARLHLEEIERKSKTVFYTTSNYFLKLEDRKIYIDKRHTVADSNVLIINTEDVGLIKETFESEGFVLEEIDAYNLFSTQLQLDYSHSFDVTEYPTEFFDLRLLPFFTFFTSIKSNRVSAINISMDLGSDSNKFKHVFSFVNCKLCIDFEELPASGRRWANKLRRSGWKRFGKDWYCPNCDEYRVANNE